MKRVVLVRPSGPRNVGAVARASANFGPCEVVLVAPERVKVLLRGSHVVQHALTLENGRPVNHAIAVVEVEKAGGEPVKRVTLRDVDRPERPDAPSRPDEVAVYRPKVALHPSARMERAPEPARAPQRMTPLAHTLAENRLVRPPIPHYAHHRRVLVREARQLGLAGRGAARSSRGARASPSSAARA